MRKETVISVTGVTGLWVMLPSNNRQGAYLRTDGWRNTAFTQIYSSPVVGSSAVFHSKNCI
jgi:hypothetical protein